MAIRRFVVLLACLFSVFLIVMFLGSREMFLIGLIVIVGMGPLVLVAYPAVNRLLLPQTLRIADGTVELKAPLLTRRFDLADCQWDLEASVSDPWLLTSPAIMLQVRSGWGLPPTRAYACVDDASRRLWTAFLTFAAEQGTTAVFGVPGLRAARESSGG